MMIARTMCALALVVVAAGCESDGRLSKSAGRYADVQAGIRLESQIGGDKSDLAVTAAGTLLGPYLGSDVGKSLSVSDRVYAEDAANKSLATALAGQPSNWSNPETGHVGTFTPTNTYRSYNNLFCRDYVQDVTVKGQSNNNYGTACQTAGGSWRVAIGIPPRRAGRAVSRRSSPNGRR